MAKTVVLKAEQREVGSKHAAKVRRAGKLPGVVYGHKQEPVSVAVDSKALLDGLHSGNRVFAVEIEGKNANLLVKDLQYDHYGIEILHVDFMRVDLDEKAHVTVAVVLKGEAPGANQGGIVETELDHLELNCPVTAIPEAIELSIRELGLGDSIHAKELKIPSGAELLTDPEAVIVHCQAHKVAEEVEVEGEESAEPEVITEKKEESEE